MIGYAAVNISIEDSNDNVPRFVAGTDIEAHIGENKAVGTEVIQIEVEDLDHGQNGHVLLAMLELGQGSFQCFLLKPLGMTTHFLLLYLAYIHTCVNGSKISRHLWSVFKDLIYQ